MFQFFKNNVFGLKYALFIFIRTILQEHNAHFCSKFKNKLRIIPASAKEQSLKISIKGSKQNSSKCHTFWKVHFASCLHFFFI